MRHPGRFAALLALSCALVPAACGDDDGARAGCDGAPADGSKRLTYVVDEEGTVSPAMIKRTAAQLCERTKALGVDDAVVRVNSSGEADKIVVFVPRGARLPAEELQRAARLRFYDWEANVVGSPEVPIKSLAEAQAIADQVPHAIVIHNEPPEPGYFVIRNRPALRNEDVRNPRQGVDEASGEVTISFDFPEAGRRKFQDLTGQVAKRLTPEVLPHFAVVVDAELVALPTVDSQAKLSASSGVTMVGRTGAEESKLLADFLEIGYLPVDLVLER